TGRLFHTNVACRLLDLQTGRCSRYADRFRWVPDCVQLTPAEVQQINWLPVTCAYRLRAEGKSLPNWHPLVSGDPHSTRRAGMSICGRAIPERHAKYLADHIIESPLP
ncbi:MAG: YcgN family cysteine cluster protein, partial [Candidatus Contendobacter sp.]|nr:YcgN family cysteine cluster protein [Candidatus Contendobacter sp.]